MSDTFKYKITDVDLPGRRVRVEFEDGGFAVVPLMAPLPTNMEQFDKIVRQFSMPKELVESREVVPEVPLDFLMNALGHTREAERFSFFKAAGMHKRPKDADGNPIDVAVELGKRIDALEAVLATKANKITKKKAE